MSGACIGQISVDVGPIGGDVLQDDDNSRSWEQQPSYQDPGPSGPLAGENVMNVVLVGAECAPWSKTGKTQHVSDPSWQEATVASAETQQAYSC